jgi:hypothetical protein
MITSDLGATIHHGDQLLYKIDTVLVAKTPMISLSRGNDLDEDVDNLIERKLKKITKFIFQNEQLQRM